MTSWVVSVDLPAGQGPRRPRSATLALRRARRGVAVRVPPGTEDAVAGRDRRRVDARDLESGHAKGGVPGGGDGIGPREAESGHGIGPRTKADPWAPRLARVRATLDRARRFKDWIDDELGRKAADLARKEGLTRARVCQLLLLLKLVPEIRAEIERPGRTGRVLGEIELRQIAGLERGAQMARYRAMLGIDENGQPVDLRAERQAAKVQARHRGLKAHVERARELRALVEGGRFSSMGDLARYSGMSGTRAQQLLNLLDLHPEILGAIERGDADGISEPAIRHLSRQRDQRGQLEAWARLRASGSC